MFVLSRKRRCYSMLVSWDVTVCGRRVLSRKRRCYSMLVSWDITVCGRRVLSRKRRCYSVLVSWDVTVCGRHVDCRRYRRLLAARLTGTTCWRRCSGLLLTLHRNDAGRWLPQRRWAVFVTWTVFRCICVHISQKYVYISIKIRKEVIGAYSS